MTQLLATQQMIRLSTELVKTKQILHSNNFTASLKNKSKEKNTERMEPNRKEHNV